MRYDAMLVLDFGGQYCHLIARRVRENMVYSVIVPHNITIKEIEKLSESLNVRGLILSGGPSSVYEDDSPRLSPEILDMDLPILGICYGHQLLAHIDGEMVKPAEKKEYGVTYVTITHPVGILERLNPKEKVWMSHGDAVYALPDGYEVLAHTESCPVAAFQHKNKPIYGVQWHPEVMHTENGVMVLRNFIFQICGCQPNWKMEDLIEGIIEEIRVTIDEGKAIMALSGGIDSSTAAALATMAVGRRLTAIFVDHGFMREDEPQFVKKTFDGMGMNLIVLDVKERFYSKLKNVSDPELKRKIIGEEFIRVFEEVAKDIGAEYLIQGTIYPDRVESGFRRFSDKIKSHHNVAGLPLKIKFKGIIEPLRDLYKDEVREVAQRIGLPSEIVYRQPFPGPGLAVRIIGEVTPEKVEITRKADRIVREEIESSALSGRLWQYFAVLTNTLTTGVKGDVRAYGYTIAIRIVESKEAMTANFAKIPYEILERISTRVVNEIPEVIRVVYDITHKPPSTIEWE